MRFVKYYSLELYTVLSLLLIALSAIFVTPDVIQKFTLAYIFLFVLHEWEEGHYPGGFIDLITGLLGGGVEVSEETKKGSRLYTGIYLLALTFIPYFAHSYAWLILPAVFLGLWEGIVHVLGIKIFQRKRPYTPGMITAECELVMSICVLWYFASHNLATPLQVLAGIVLMILGFMCMQRALVHSIGRKYRELPGMMRENFKRIRS